MFKAARLAKIKEILIDRNQIDVQTLSTLLNVSSVTIRNDLEILEQQGYLRRTHGGAILNSTDNAQRELSRSPLQLNIEFDKYRDEIAQIAAQIIGDDEWIYIGPGLTCAYIVKHLNPHNHYNIITNNLIAASSIGSSASSNVILTGGILDVKNGYLTGDMLDSALKNIHVSKAFFSVGGVDLANGYSVSTYGEKSLFEKLCQISSQLIILADHQKFNRMSFLRIGDLKMAKTLISNENIPDDYKAYFFENGIQLFTTYDIKKSSVHDGK